MFSYLFSWCMSVWECMVHTPWHMWRGQGSGSRSQFSFLPSLSLGSNSGFQIWWQVPFLRTISCPWCRWFKSDAEKTQALKTDVHLRAQCTSSLCHHPPFAQKILNSVQLSSRHSSQCLLKDQWELSLFADFIVKLGTWVDLPALSKLSLIIASGWVCSYLSSRSGIFFPVIFFVHIYEPMRWSELLSCPLFLILE